ncbi:type III-A CRISPR-associated protein Cas10/Csm1 [Laspinema olomoucense]|uniref:type III-A CRISPR-associated protein Cas10/Csm1 n=1 Tax=Laspinema olomoucense TaxID=3231600 RepID=UPI0021BA9E53|nr:type III-A CRISPR-associated protein Cas10/Csm1 [Laspinema sp. D3c]MCT7995979.1 type III-A CRISPR-associated protein Cas10/Csm1 [Laspinema sp. D3c]
MTSLSHAQALSIAQEAVLLIGRWAGAFPSIPTATADSKAVTQAKVLLKWPQESLSNLEKQVKPLRLLFDAVNLSNGQGLKKHYWPVGYIQDHDSYPPIPYPQTNADDLDEIKPPIQQAIVSLQPDEWNNLSLLMLILEKFGSYVSFGEQDNVSLLDLTQTTAAVAAALANQADAKCLTLIAGDLSGIQKFIYTISSDGALKSLRARSFYLELVTQEVVEQLLSALDLPRTNVIYAGGGNLYLLAPADERKTVENTMAQVRDLFNEWLRKTFQGQIFLALDCLSFSTEAVGTPDFAKVWEKATKKLAGQKSRKFQSQISELLKPKPAYEPCRVCHRDDLPSLEPLNYQEADSCLACLMCRTMFDLGAKLFKVEAIARSKHSTIKEDKDPLNIGGTFYYLFPEWKTANAIPDKESTLFLVNDWTLAHYRTRYAVPLLLGNYGQRCPEPSADNNAQLQFMNAREMAEKAKGINRVASLRMDVDNLGKIFAKGLGSNQTLPRLAGLSRQMSYFFKVYLNSLAKNREANLPREAKKLSDDSRQNLLFIYAGGDDLFVSGTWNEIVEFAFDIYQSFRAYTGYNTDITLSGGISIDGAKFPLYQAAEASGNSENAAKNNGRDSLGLFEQVFKWDEWLGCTSPSVADPDAREYLQSAEYPPILGIFPLIEQLEKQQIETNYARSFVRSLLATAQMQEQMIKEIETKRRSPIYKQEINDIRYYLHLPQMAYTLARLPQRVREHPEFAPVRKSLNNPYNAPYFRAIATWLELLNRAQSND